MDYEMKRWTFAIGQILASIENPVLWWHDLELIENYL